jgi:hypothetical protein
MKSGGKMKIEYTLTISALCPADGRRNTYTATFRTRAMLLVERLLEIVKPFAEQKLYQEELTATLAKEVSCQVETFGNHSGVTIRCVAGEL